MMMMMIGMEILKMNQMSPHQKVILMVMMMVFHQPLKFWK